MALFGEDCAWINGVSISGVADADSNSDTYSLTESLAGCYANTRS